MCGRAPPPRPDGLIQGYVGCAIGTGKQLARTEIEKLKLAELSCRDALKEIARMYVRSCHDHRTPPPPGPSLLCAIKAHHRRPYVREWRLPTTRHSIQMVHDDVKDKPYELELSWICPEVRKKAATSARAGGRAARSDRLMRVTAPRWGDGGPGRAVCRVETSTSWCRAR